MPEHLVRSIVDAVADDAWECLSVSEALRTLRTVRTYRTSALRVQLRFRAEGPQRATPWNVQWHDTSLCTLPYKINLGYVYLAVSDATASSQINVNLVALLMTVATEWMYERTQTCVVTLHPTRVPIQYSVRRASGLGPRLEADVCELFHI